MTTSITINGKSREVEGDFISYWSVVGLHNELFPDKKIGEGMKPGIDYVSKEYSDLMYPNESVQVSEGLQFNVDRMHLA